MDSLLRLRNKFIKCGITGWCLEIFWTGMGSLLHSDKRMLCTTSLLMFPIYGMAACLKPLCGLLKNRNTLFRGGVYTVIIFTAEYISGSLLRYFHMCPWDYTGAKTSFHGLIRLDYAPVWFLTGLLMERLLGYGKKITGRFIV